MNQQQAYNTSQRNGKICTYTSVNGVNHRLGIMLLDHVALVARSLAQTRYVEIWKGGQRLDYTEQFTRTVEIHLSGSGGLSVAISTKRLQSTLCCAWWVLTACLSIWERWLRSVSLHQLIATVSAQLPPSRSGSFSPVSPHRIFGKEVKMKNLKTLNPCLSSLRKWDLRQRYTPTSQEVYLCCRQEQLTSLILSRESIASRPTWSI